MDNKLFLSKKSATEYLVQQTKLRKNILDSGAYDNLSKNQKNRIAGMHNGMQELITGLKDSTLVLGGGKKEPTKNIYQNDEKIGQSVYGKLTSGKFFETLSGDVSSLVHKQTGEELMNSVIKSNGVMRLNKINYNRTTQSGMVDFQNLFNTTKNFKDILDNGGKIVTYDLETLGGVNSHGHQQFDFITELSASVWDMKGAGVAAPSEASQTINSLLGFSSKEYNKVKGYIEGLADKAPKDLTNMDQVYLKRLSLFSGSTFETSVNGFEHSVTNITNPDDIVSNVENALKGIERYRDIGKQQEAFTGKSGVAFEQYKKGYIERYKKLVYDGIGKDGQSIGNFVSAAHNSAMFDDKAVGHALGQTVEHQAGRGLDTYQMIKYMQEYLGQGAHLPSGKIATNKFGLATQDQLKNFFGYDEGAVAAHNAKEDEHTLFRILTGQNIEGPNGTSSYGNQLVDNIYKVNDKLDGLKNTHQVEGLTGRDGIFLMDKTAQKDWGSNKNGLSFTYNPLDKSYKTFDGFRVGTDGKVVKEGFNGFGPKAGALYTHKAYKVDLNTANWKDAFAGSGLTESEMERYYDQYSTLDSIYVLQSREYKDMQQNAGKFGRNNAFKDSPVHVRILTSEDQLATAMGNKVAYKNRDGSAEFKDELLKGLDLKTTSIEDGKVVVRNVNSAEAHNMLLNRSAYRTSVDGSARTIRDMEYERVAKLRRYKLENHMSVSERIAGLVSGNQKLKTNVTQNLIEELGWQDFHTKAQTLLPETIAKTSVLDNYADALSPILSSMEEVFADMGLEDSFKVTNKKIKGINRKVVTSSADKTLKAKKNIMFQNVMTNVLEQLSQDTAVLSNATPSIFSADELNKVDFFKSELFPGLEKNQVGHSIANSNGKYVTLDLNKNDALMNMFFNNKFGNVDVSKKGNAGFESLFQAYDSIGKDSRFGGVWEGLGRKDLLEYQKGGNLSQLNSIMMDKMQNFVNNKRSTESGFGLYHPRYVQDYSDVKGIQNLLSGVNPKKLKGMVDKEMRSSVGNIYLADESDKGLIGNIVDNYFMTFSQKDLEKQMSGLTADQQKVMRSQYDMSRKQAMTSAEDLIKSIKDTNINLGVRGSGQDAKMFLLRGNEMKTLDMHKYVLNNGIINHRINGNDYATNFSYNVNDLINRSGGIINPDSDKVLNGIKVTSNVEEALGRTHSITDAVRYAKQGERDQLDAIVRKVRQNSGMLREVGARRENQNFNNSIERAMQINTNPLIGILPELKDQGLINSLEKSFKIKPENAGQMNELIEKIRGMKVRPRSINELLASEQNLFYQAYHSPLVDMINNKANVGDIIKSINPHVQDTKFAEGMMTLNNSPFSHGAAKFDPTTRSVANQQGNSILYNRKSMEKDIEKFLGKNSKHLSIGGNLMTGAADKYVNHNGKYTSGLTMKYLSIDSNALKNIFVDDVEKVRKGESNRFSKFLTSKYGSTININQAAEVLAERAMGLSTYEQQSAINARVSYVAFHKNNAQLINSKKELIVSHTKNLGVIEATSKTHKLPVIINNGKIEYQLGYSVNKGDVLGMFGDEGNVVKSRFDGIFRGRYFDKYGNVVSEKELHNAIKGKKLNDNQILQALNEKYNFKYQVMNKFEDYGHKLYNDASEKSTADVMDIALGKIDKGLVGVLKQHGFEDLGGKVLSREYIEDYLTPALGKDAKGIVSRILKERFAFSDSLSGFKEFDGIAQITNLNTAKHESISMAATNVVEALKRNTSGDVNKYYKAIFGNQLEIRKDGTLITDNVSKLTVDGFKENYNKYGLSKEEGAHLQGILDDQGLLKDANKNPWAHTGYSHVTHAYDDPAGTHSSAADITNLQKEYSHIEERLQTAKSPEEIQSLTQRLSAVDHEISKAGTQKGLKFDNRMNLNLERAVYDNDSIGLAKSKLSGEDFKQYFGHATGANGKVSEQYLGKSVLNPVTSIMRDRTLVGFGETRLSSVAGDKRYKYLMDSYGKSANTLSIEKAEKAYSYQQGVKALEFNSSKDFSKVMYDKLTKGSTHTYNDFKAVNLSGISPHDASKWLDLDIGGQGRTVTSAANNPYTQNLMIKTGLGGKEDYLAIARMPERHFEDSLIKQSHIQKLGKLQGALQEINSGNLTGKALTSKQNYARSVVQEIVAAQKHDLTSKSGLYGDLISSRLSQSFFGKASGLTINTTKAFGKDSYENLKRLNSKTFLDTAMFDGKSLLKHYSEGKAIDAVGVSRQAFEDMGYFKEDMIKKVLGANGTAAQMEHKLSTVGDSFMATRFPRIMEGSDKVVMGYLHPELKGNQILALGHTGASMKLDHDGDQFAIGRITNSNGESLLNYAVGGKQADGFVHSQKAMLMQRAVNENQYWDSSIRNQIDKEIKVAIGGNGIKDIARKRSIDNDIFSAIMDNKDITRSKMEKLLSHQEFGGYVQEAMSYEGKGNAHESVINKLKAIHGTDTAEYAVAKSKYATAFSYQLLKDEVVAKSAKNSIGEINVTNYKMKDVATALMDKTAENYSYKSRLMYDMMHLSEQAAISSKSSIAGLSPDRAKIWNDSAMNLIKKKGEASVHINAMKDWSKQYLVKDLDMNYYWDTSKKFQETAADLLNNKKSLTKEAFTTMMENDAHKGTMQNRMVNDFIETLSSLREVKGVDKALDYLSYGHSTTGVTKGMTRPVTMDHFENVSDKFVQLMKSSNKDLNSNMKFLNVEGHAKESIFGSPNIIDKVISGTEEELGNEAKGIGRKIAEGASDLFKAAKGSKIAMGAIGIAAGVMMLGYVGGRPRPAETQAMEEANDYQQPQQGLMDQGMMPSTMGGQQGYVVNINARSDKGKSHAISAIQQAISSGTSSSVNISMNINDNYGNINDRDIQKAIKDAL